MKNAFTAALLLAGTAWSAPDPPLPNRPKYPDPVLPPLNPRHISASGHVRDDKGNPLAEVLVSDGEHVVKTDAKGAYRLSFKLRGPRFVCVTSPRGYRPAGPFWQTVPRDGKETDVRHDFVFAQDQLADRDAFSFLAAGDSQFNDLATYVHLREEFGHFTRMSGEPAFLTSAGDLTMFGSQWEMDLYKEIANESHLPLYNCFGGHDGNYARKNGGKGSITNYCRNLGPAWYSWDYGPVHFLTYVSESYFLTEDQQAAQDAWLRADLAAQPPRRPVVIVTHIPPRNDVIASRLETNNVIGVVYGHWHLINVCGPAGVPFIDTTPMRGRDWGAFTRTFRVVTFTDGKLKTEIRVCGQEERLEIVAPQGKVGKGSAPIQIKAYDTSRRVTGVSCEVSAGNKRFPLALSQTGAWTWAAQWQTDALPAGKIEVRATATDEKGRTWTRNAEAALTGEATARVALDDDWPGLFRTGTSRVRTTSLGQHLELAWTVNTGGRNEKAVTPITYDGRVYVGIDNKEAGHPGVGVACYSPEDGTRLWHTPTDGSVCSAPTAADGVVYAISSLGTCHALEARTGTEKWHSRPFGEPNGHCLVQCCPVLEGDELVLMGDGGKCVVLNPATGAVKRSMSIGGGQVHFSFPSIHGGRLYGGIRKKAVALDWLTGKNIWTTPISTGKIAATPIPHQGRLYINASTLTCLAEETGKKLWQQSVPTSGNGLSVAVPVGDLVLANGAYLRAFDARTGDLQWEFQYPYGTETARTNQRQKYGGQSSPAVAGDTVYVGSDDGHLYAFSLRDGKLLQRHNLGVPVKGSPVISGNALLISDWDGNLYCFVSR
ncbi:MAG: PQQ-binding-like beta-propeller repeat protein [Lentisphaerae bacterium]|jgi:outer membrane protein assembly factor BamB|nr:PQQ-binding-like beta-propeller repeat protein [Lentisphaerota bacterium]MBT7054740.1 PQQ-binding-like beta-propeller repeat protein [Lentisphaerota bacterium]MBT7847947.1 PQQ-binding-like beta-propeller repeat protein [Lentisphaerota bacterium]